MLRFLPCVSVMGREWDPVRLDRKCRGVFTGKEFLRTFDSKCIKGGCLNVHRRWYHGLHNGTSTDL